MRRSIRLIFLSGGPTFCTEKYTIYKTPLGNQSFYNKMQNIARILSDVVGWEVSQVEISTNLFHRIVVQCCNLSIVYSIYYTVQCCNLSVEKSNCKRKIEMARWEFLPPTKPKCYNQSKPQLRSRWLQ